MAKVQGLDLGGLIEWTELPSLTHPHVYMPVVGVANRRLFVIGGGDNSMMGGDEVTTFFPAHRNFL